MREAMSIDYNNPTFQPFPYNNNRTAWRPIGFPIIMVVPRRRDITGETISNSQVFNVKVLIENVPQEARVAGHDHVGLLYPDRELYAITLSSQDLANRLIPIEDLDVYRDGEIVNDPPPSHRAMNGGEAAGREDRNQPCGIL